MLTSALRWTSSIDRALLVEQAVLVLAEAVELLVRIGGEALFEPGVAVAVRGAQPRAGPPEVRVLLGQQLGAVGVRGR